MKLRTIAQYTKIYSEIPPFQRAGKVEYTLRETDGGLLLTVDAGMGPSCAVECVLKNVDRQTGCALLRLLYENAVEAVAAPDVVKDLCAAL